MQQFPIEAMLRNIVKLPNVFILAVLDCYREKIPLKRERGGGDPAFSLDLPKNLIIIHGCPPGKTVRGDSKLTLALLLKLRKIVN